jgi:hypothetical protein
VLLAVLLAVLQVAGERGTTLSWQYARPHPTAGVLSRCTPATLTWLMTDVYKQSFFRTGVAQQMTYARQHLDLIVEYAYCGAGS